MTVAQVEVIVEEPSMEAALRALLPKLLTEIPFSIYTHQGKTDLLQSLPQRLRGYAAWLPPDWRIVVVVDRDDDDCVSLKQRLERFAADAGLLTRTRAGGGPWQVVNRLAIEELEAWYFGDWEAVRAAYPRVPLTIPRRAAFRVPDNISGGTWEALERVFQRAGLFTTGLRKIEVARAIAARMDPDRNNSRSFRVFRDALREMTPV
jgi:hypothetical protein